MQTATFRLKAHVLLLFLDAISASRARDQEWRAGFEAMGADPETNNVEYMIPAAREVLFGPENGTVPGSEGINSSR